MRTNTAAAVVGNQATAGQGFLKYNAGSFRQCVQIEAEDSSLQLSSELMHTPNQSTPDLNGSISADCRFNDYAYPVSEAPAS